MLLLLATVAHGENTVDWSRWDRLLRDHIQSGSVNGIRTTTFDYAAVQDDSGEFQRLVQDIRRFERPHDWSREEALAHWINLYNVGAVKLVLQGAPVESIWDCGWPWYPVWFRRALWVGNYPLDLWELEHDIIRGFDEPLIHVAINCASVSCPDLRPEAYSGLELATQLQDQAAVFLSNEGKGFRLDRARREVHLSQIFSMYRGDFGGETGVRDFIETYHPYAGTFPEDWRTFRLVYLDYDWSLNAAPEAALSSTESQLH